MDMKRIAKTIGSVLLAGGMILGTTAAVATVSAGSSWSKHIVASKHLNSKHLSEPQGKRF
jgi:ribosomal protein L30E